MHTYASLVTSGLRLSLAGIAMFAIAACSDDGEPSTDTNGGKPDGGGIYIDQGNSTKDTGGIVVADQAVVVDQEVKPLTCTGILTCAETCNQNPICIETCKSKGTAEAKGFLDAMVACQSSAFQSAECKPVCPNPMQPDQTCITCLTKQCETDIVTCLGGGGPAEDGFGDSCDLAAPSCKTGFQCMAVSQGAAKGFCNKACEEPGGYCSGYADGQMAVCAFQAGPNYFCGFLCKDPAFGTKACPTGMACTGASQQGAKFCEPE